MRLYAKRKPFEVGGGVMKNAWIFNILGMLFLTVPIWLIGLCCYFCEPFRYFALFLLCCAAVFVGVVLTASCVILGVSCFDEARKRYVGKPVEPVE